MMEYWNIGILECWNAGGWRIQTPIFQQAWRMDLVKGTTELRRWPWITRLPEFLTWCRLPYAIDLFPPPSPCTPWTTPKK